MSRSSQESFHEVLGPAADYEPSPSSILQNRTERIPRIVHMPRLLERCSITAVVAMALFTLSVAIDMAFPRFASLAVDLMLVSTAAIVGTMVIAAAVAIRTLGTSDRAGHPA